MNKNIYKLLFGFSVILFTATSCEKDWLEVTSDTQIRAEEQFETPDGYKDALIGVYIGMTAPEMYSKDMTWNLVDLLSQQYSTLPSLAVYDEVQQFNYESVKATAQIEEIWSHSYNVIANINIALDFIEDTNVLHPIDQSIIKGELLALRVFIHLDMMRLFGKGNLADRNLGSEYTIPYVTGYGKDVTPQLTYDETFAVMEADLAEALELLKEDPIYPANRDENYYTEVNRQGFYDRREQRMNYYAAKALQARLNLWQGGADNLEAARLAAEEVIQDSPFQLINPESHNTAMDPLLYPEVIFSLDVTAFQDIVDPFLDASTGTSYDALFFASSTAGELFETSNVNIGVADIRYNSLLETQSRGLVSIKLFQETQRFYTNQMPLMKLPEMYYIAAEAYLETNQVDKATELLNIVRASRGILQEIPAGLTHEEVKAELIKEYRKEFISEGQLFYQYKRLGLNHIPGLTETVEVDDEIYVLPYPDNEVEFGNR